MSTAEIDFSRVESGMLDLIKSLAPDTLVAWWPTPKKHQIGHNKNGQRIDIRLTGLLPVGRDGQFQSFDAAAPAGSEFQSCVGGIRQMRVQIEGWTVKQGLAASALPVVEAVRSKLYSREAVGALAAMGLSLIETGVAAPVSERVSNRTRLRWTIPLTFEGVQTYQTAATTYIESATVTGEIDACGDVIPIVTTASAA